MFKIMAENLSNLSEDMNALKDSRAEKIPDRIHSRKSTPRHIIVKLPKTRNKEKKSRIHKDLSKINSKINKKYNWKMDKNMKRHLTKPLKAARELTYKARCLTYKEKIIRIADDFLS